ncbi:hypothetical protein [Proteus sp. G2300]|uniref:hypothetical protein n=2 Tax=unclassified Proteus (in: enterobacteria) TaxID=257482 RepID=UPI0019299FA4|nr:hypothetical protein [Proteus sp. G2300]NBN86596.1 hypothetical protein [Proteus sp. G2300]
MSQEIDAIRPFNISNNRDMSRKRIFQMDDGAVYKITGTWNGKPFEKLMQAECELDAEATIIFWANLCGAHADNLSVEYHSAIN